MPNQPDAKAKITPAADQSIDEGLSGLLSELETQPIPDCLRKAALDLQQAIDAKAVADGQAGQP